MDQDKKRGSAGVREYYRRITDVDIGAVARELLGGRILHASPKLLQCDCPHHASDSKRSLHIMLDRQGWYCFGCGVGGDVLQLVEFVQSGNVTRGQSGSMPGSHRQARDFLAQRVGMPPLSGNGTSPEAVARAEADRAEELRVQMALTSLAAYYHERLKAAPEVLEWFQSKYGISAETIEALQIGYAANDAWKDGEGKERPGVIGALTSGPEPLTLRELAATGAFFPTPQDTLAPFFHERIVFPYWSRGRVVFLIGRKTPWTPDTPWEGPKYKKLPVHDGERHSYVAPCLRNDHLFNEDMLLTRPARLVLTEGVTDCISLMEHGFPALSPVTVRIRSADIERFVDKVSSVKTVFVCQDNELSGVGLDGALQTARLLGEHRIETRLVILPLGPKHEEARRELAERFGLDTTVNAKDLRQHIEGRSEEDVREVDRLLADAKIDVNEYFAGGHTTEEFERLLESAQTPIEVGISQLPVDATEGERDRLLTPILREIAAMDPLGQSRHLKLIQERYGPRALTLGTLRQQLQVIQKAERQSQRDERRQKTLRPTAPPGTCRARIENVLTESEATTGSPDYARAAEATFDWFKNHGARFYRTQQGEPFLFFENALLWMDSGGRGSHRLYESTIYKHTGIVPTTTTGRTFYAVLSNLAAQHGEVRNHLTWLHTDVARHAIYFNLNNPENEIAKITPEGVEILKNGGNPDGIILADSRKMLPLRYQPDADPLEAERLIVDLIIGNLTCPVGDRFLIQYWLSAYLLLDFTGTRPMTRFEGPAASGKTTASKIISTLLYGEPQQKKSTDAANYTDGSQNPLIVLDNIETRQMTDELQAFMLTCITGISKEKRKGGTDTETVIERTKCLLNTTGIEPLGGEYSEVLSRSFIIEFSLDESASGVFLEAKVLAAIREHRDLILSVLMKKTSQALALIRDGAQERVMRLLHESLGGHNKRRANDYLSLMYLMTLAGEPAEEIERSLAELRPAFLDQIASLNTVTMETARESNPISTVLAGLFRAHRQALEADRRNMSPNLPRTSEDVFRERYQLEFATEDHIEGVLARDLFVALKRFAKDFNLSFPMQSVQQFAQRFANDLDTVRESGFVIESKLLPHRVRTYDITFVGHER